MVICLTVAIALLDQPHTSIAAPTERLTRSWGPSPPFTVHYQPKSPADGRRVREKEEREEKKKTTRTTKNVDEPSTAKASALTHLFASGSWGPHG